MKKNNHNKNMREAIKQMKRDDEPLDLQLFSILECRLVYYYSNAITENILSCNVCAVCCTLHT